MKTKTVRSSKAGVPSFALGTEKMVERDSIPYILFRRDLQKALHSEKVPRRVPVYIRNVDHLPAEFLVTQGTTQRGKKFIQIGCKRFVGENRRVLIQWAKSYKG